MGEPDQRIVAGQGSGLKRNGLQLGELIGAAGEETLAQWGDGIGGDGRGSWVVERIFKQKTGRGGMAGGPLTARGFCRRTNFDGPYCLGTDVRFP